MLAGNTTSHVTIIENPNGNAATFDLGKNIIAPFSAMTISRQSDIKPFVPLASTVLDHVKAVSFIELSSNDNENTRLTANTHVLGGRVMNWNDKNKSILFNFIDSTVTQLGSEIIDIPALEKRPYITPLDMKGDRDLEGLALAFNDVVKPLSVRHGGSFALVDIRSQEVEVKTGLFKKETRQHNTALILTFGACSGCSSFDTTYGNKETIQAINQKLAAQGNPHRIHAIAEANAENCSRVPANVFQAKSLLMRPL